jgi:CRP-like cAMP-binding protein
MELKAYKAAELVCKRGEIAKSMYFIVEGFVEVVSDDLLTVYDRIETGDFFGETGVLNATKRNATIVTGKDNAVLLVLSGEEIHSTLAKFPDSYESIVLASTARAQKANDRSQTSSTKSPSSSFTGSSTDLGGEDLMNSFKMEISKTANEARITGNIFIKENDPKIITRMATEESSLEMFTIEKRSFSSEEISVPIGIRTN